MFRRSGKQVFRSLSFRTGSASLVKAGRRMTSWRASTRRSTRCWHAEVREAFAKMAAEPGGGTPAEFGNHVKSQIAHWSKVVKETGMKMHNEHRASDFRVTLLGHRVPIPRPDRFGPSTLIEAGDQKLLIDAGPRRDHPALPAWRAHRTDRRSSAHALPLGSHRRHSRSMAHRLAAISLRHAHHTVPCHRSDRRKYPDGASGEGLRARHQHSHRR